MTDSVKASSFGRIRGSSPSERHKYSGTTSLNEGKPFTVIEPHGDHHYVTAPTAILAIRTVTSNFRGVHVIEGHVRSARALGPCCRCGIVVFDGQRHEVKRTPGKKPKTWTHRIFCEDCC